jgi:YD repeat-containing protein
VLTYEANYTYTYDASGRPLVKTGPIKFIDPQGGSGEFQSLTTFSY